MSGSRRTVVPVHIHGPDGLTHVFAPGDEVPEDLARLVQNPDVWGGAAPVGNVAPVAPVPAPVTPVVIAPGVDPADDEDDTEVASVIPPKSGPEGSRAAWAEYAESVGVEVTSVMKRNEIIAAVTSAGKPTE